MSLNIYANTQMQQNNTAFGCKRKGLQNLLIDPIRREHIKNVMKDKKISDLEKQEFLKAQALIMSSSPKSLFRNIVANLKLLIQKSRKTDSHIINRIKAMPKYTTEERTQIIQKIESMQVNNHDDVFAFTEYVKSLKYEGEPDIIRTINAKFEECSKFAEQFFESK